MEQGEPRGRGRERWIWERNKGKESEEEAGRETRREEEDGWM